MIHIDRTLIVIASLIVSLGIVMVSSATMPTNVDLVIRHGVYLAVSVGCCLLVCLIPLDFWERSHRLCWCSAILLCFLVLLPGVGIEANGARRWISMPGFSIQPSEFSKLFLVIYVAGYLSRFRENLIGSSWILLRLMMMVGVPAFLLLLQPDFGSVVVIGATTTIMIFLAGARLSHLLGLTALATVLIVALVLFEPYRLERLVSFTDPWAVAFGSGYQLTQALIAFGRGEMIGLGLGEGIQKLFYLPEAHTDFIFAVIGEELGFLGVFAVVLLFALLVLRIFRLSRTLIENERFFSGYLSYGVALGIGIQCLINFGVNTGLLPTKGLTLPFVSFGGNSLLVCFVMLGLIFRAQLEEGTDG